MEVSPLLPPISAEIRQMARVMGLHIARIGISGATAYEVTLAPRRWISPIELETIKSSADLLAHTRRLLLRQALEL